MLRLIVKRLAALFIISFLWEAWKQRDEIKSTFRVPVVVDTDDWINKIKRNHPWLVEGASEEILDHLNLHGYEATCERYDKGVVDELIKRTKTIDEFDAAMRPLMEDIDDGTGYPQALADEDSAFQRNEIHAEQASERHYEDGSRDSV